MANGSRPAWARPTGRLQVVEMRKKETGLLAAAESLPRPRASLSPGGQVPRPYHELILKKYIYFTGVFLIFDILRGA